MGRAVKDLGAVKLLNSPSPKSNSPQKGLLRLALDFGILRVIDLWEKLFFDQNLDWIRWIDHLGVLRHSGRLFAGFLAGAFFFQNNTSLEF